MIKRRLAPGEIWRRPGPGSGVRTTAANVLGIAAALALLPVSLLVMAATLCALPLLHAVSARRKPS